MRLLELDDNEFKKLEAEISVLTTETKAYEERKKQAMKKIDVSIFCVTVILGYESK